LFGTVADSRGRTLTERRRLAGDALDVVASTFRKNYEPRLVHELAIEILRAEHAPDLHVIHNPNPESDPTEQSSAAGPLHVVIDRSPTAVEALPTTPVTLTPRRSRLGLLLGAIVTAGALWWIVGLGAVLRAAVVTLAASFATTAVRAVRAHQAGVGIARALHDQLPRLVVLGTLTVVAVGAIAADAPGSGTATPRPDPCTGLATEADCTTMADSTTTTPAELSPNYVPTTHATAPADRTPAACPPEGNRQRRLSFAGVPPRCIDFDARYTATIETNFGTFRVLLNTGRAPWTVNNFVYLARWRFFEGVTLSPDPQPLAVATSMSAGDPVAADDTDKVPGYGLTYDHNTYPDLPAPDDDRAYVVVTDPYHPNRWAVVVTEAGRNEVELNPERWPLVGQVTCGIDVITNEAPDGYYPAHTSAPIVIDTITTRQLTEATTAILQPGTECG
jgi:hypothetical protein